MMTLKLGDDLYPEYPSFVELREDMESDATLCSQLMSNQDNVNELRHELPADMAGHLDAIADDWTNIRWRIASVVLLERVADIDGFCAAARGAMAGNVKEVAHLVELLNGVDDKECDYWMKKRMTMISETTRVSRRRSEYKEANKVLVANKVLLKAGDTKMIVLPGGVTMKMVWCPATTSNEWKRISGGKDYFMMGSPTNEEGHDKDEKLHRVILTRGFWLGAYEVTQKQWRSMMRDNPSEFKGMNRPVEHVSWADCQKFIRKMGVRLKCDVRLPTEAEWEYACRAGAITAYCWGKACNGDNANCDGCIPCGTTTKGRYLGRTTTVGSYTPNAWGIFDMHGNVYEWCNDWYGTYSGNAIDPMGPAFGSTRVLRGGSWGSEAQYCRSANRFDHNPSYVSSAFGFRLYCSSERNL